MNPATGRRPAKISFSDGEVVVQAKDRPRFVMSAEKATEACAEAVRAEERFVRFEQSLLKPLHQWCMERVGHVSACYVPLPSGTIQVFIVTTSKKFDFGLAKEVAELELQLARAGWRVSVIQLPSADEASLATFFHADGALEIYADGEPAQSQS